MGPVKLEFQENGGSNFKLRVRRNSDYSSEFLLDTFREDPSFFGALGHVEWGERMIRIPVFLSPEIATTSGAFPSPLPIEHFTFA